MRINLKKLIVINNNIMDPLSENEIENEIQSQDYSETIDVIENVDESNNYNLIEENIFLKKEIINLQNEILILKDKLNNVNKINLLVKLKENIIIKQQNNELNNEFNKICIEDENQIEESNNTNNKIEIDNSGLIQKELLHKRRKARNF